MKRTSLKIDIVAVAQEVESEFRDQIADRVVLVRSALSKISRFRKKHEMDEVKLNEYELRFSNILDECKCMNLIDCQLLLIKFLDDTCTWISLELLKAKEGVMQHRQRVQESEKKLIDARKSHNDMIKAHESQLERLPHPIKILKYNCLDFEWREFLWTCWWSLWGLFLCILWTPFYIPIHFYLKRLNQSKLASLSTNFEGLEQAFKRHQEIYKKLQKEYDAIAHDLSNLQKANVIQS